MEQLVKNEDYEQVKAFIKELHIIQERFLELAKELPKEKDKRHQEKRRRSKSPWSRITRSLQRWWSSFTQNFKQRFVAFLIVVSKFIGLLGLITLFIYIAFASFKVNLSTVLAEPPPYIFGYIIIIILIIIGTSVFYYLLLMVLKKRKVKNHKQRAQKKSDKG